MGIELAYIGAGLSLLSLTLALLATWAYRRLRSKDAKLVAEGHVVTARVVEQVDTGGDGFDHRLAYDVGGQEFSTVTRGQSLTNVGDIIEVRYHPKRPTWARRNTAGELWQDSNEAKLFVWVGWVSVVFFAVLALVCARFG